MARLILPVFLFLVLVWEANGQNHSECGSEMCSRVYCACPTSRIPGNFTSNETPQLILFSFNGPLSEKHGDMLRSIFTRRRRNPNGTPIRMTMFVSDDQERTDYCTVNRMWAAGHEIGSFSVNRRKPRSWWATASEEEWEKQIHRQKEYLYGNGSIPSDDIVGFRSPYLQPGGNAQYKFATELSYNYDSTLIFPVVKPRLWSYRMIHPTNYSCFREPCPDGSFPDVWQIPIQPLTDRFEQPCIYLDDCINKPKTADEVYIMLYNNFIESYSTNRAPLMINLLDYLDWFDNSWALKGVNMFIDELLSQPTDDIWFVTYWDMIQWMKEPKKLDKLRDFGPFDRTQKPASECVEERRQSTLNGRWLLIAEVILCVGGYLWLYYKEHK